MREHLWRVADIVFVMLGNRPAIRWLPAPGKEAAIHHPFTERAPRVLPTARLLLPDKVLHKHRGQERFDQPRFRRPGQTAFECRVTDVEAESDMLRIKVPNHRIDVPDR